jgi:hypothetical protein
MVILLVVLSKMCHDSSVAPRVKKQLGIIERFSKLFPRIERYDGAEEGVCEFW